MMSYNDRFGFWFNPTFFIDARLYEIKLNSNSLKNQEAKLSISLSNTFTFMQQELIDRANLGEGALDFKVYETELIFITDINTFKFSNIINNKKIFSVFTELGFDSSKPIRSQEPNPLPDRKELDDIIFDAIGLTEEERKEVYWATAELVQNRLNKAKSV